MPPNLDRAKRKYEEFSGHKPSKVSRVKLDGDDVAAYKLGQAVGVAYEATRDGKKAQYFHKFTKRARPDLTVRDDGKRLYFTGGRYTVTDRGIEDMPYAFLVNPSRRRLAKRRKSRSAPIMARTVRRRRRRTRTTTYARNPRPLRRYRRRRTSVTTYARNPVRHRVRRAVRRSRFRRNPIGGGVSFSKMFLPAVMIGAGAVLSELAMGYLPLPAIAKTGWTRHVTKGAIGVAGGLALAKFGRQRKLGEAFALGALVIASHDAIKDFILQMRPGTQFGMYMPSRRMGSFGDSGDNAYGYVNPAQLARARGMGMYLPFSPGGFNGASGGFATDATAGVSDYSGV